MSFFGLLNMRNLCALAGGHVFNTHGYGFAFGTDDVSFIPWTQAITLLKESGEIDSQRMYHFHDSQRMYQECIRPS